MWIYTYIFQKHRRIKNTWPRAWSEAYNLLEKMCDPKPKPKKCQNPLPIFKKKHLSSAARFFFLTEWEQSSKNSRLFTQKNHSKEEFNWIAKSPLSVSLDGQHPQRICCVLLSNPHLPFCEEIVIWFSGKKIHLWMQPEENTDAFSDPITSTLYILVHNSSPYLFLGRGLLFSLDYPQKWFPTQLRSILLVPRFRLPQGF